VHSKNSAQLQDRNRGVSEMPLPWARRPLSDVHSRRWTIGGGQVAAEACKHQTTDVVIQYTATPEGMVWYRINCVYIPTSLSGWFRQDRTRRMFSDLHLRQNRKQRQKLNDITQTRKKLRLNLKTKINRSQGCRSPSPRRTAGLRPLPQTSNRPEKAIHCTTASETMT